MPIIFLDIDGVLNNAAALNHPKRADLPINQGSLALMQRLCDTTSAMKTKVAMGPWPAPGRPRKEPGNTSAHTSDISAALRLAARVAVDTSELRPCCISGSRTIISVPTPNIDSGASRLTAEMAVEDSPTDAAGNDRAATAQ